MNIIQGYALTADERDEEIVELYEQLEPVLKITNILGDFNAMNMLPNALVLIEFA